MFTCSGYVCLPQTLLTAFTSPVHRGWLSAAVVGISMQQMIADGAVNLHTGSNQPMEFTVRAGEPDVTHRTSWPESTGECNGRPKVFGQHCAPKRGECCLDRNQTRQYAAAECSSKGGNQTKSAVHFQQHSCRNGDRCVDLWVVSQGATYQFQP